MHLTLPPPIPTVNGQYRSSCNHTARQPRQRSAQPPGKFTTTTVPVAVLSADLDLHLGQDEPRGRIGWSFSLRPATEGPDVLPHPAPGEGDGKLLTRLIMDTHEAGQSLLDACDQQLSQPLVGREACTQFVNPMALVSTSREAVQNVG